MIPKIYGYLAGGIVLLLIVSAVFGVMKYGEKVGKQDAEITRLKGELAKEKATSDDLAEALREKALAEKKWIEAATKWEIAYNKIMLQPPRVIYRNLATTTPTAIQVGDCDRAATNAWDVLVAAELVQ